MAGSLFSREMLGRLGLFDGMPLGWLGILGWPNGAIANYCAVTKRFFCVRKLPIREQFWPLKSSGVLTNFCARSRRCAAFHKCTRLMMYSATIDWVSAVYEIETQQHQLALAVSRCPFAAAEECHSGKRDVGQLLPIAKQHLAAVDHLEYLDLVNYANLEPMKALCGLRLHFAWLLSRVNSTDLRSHIAATDDTYDSGDRRRKS
ncbi:hypothetical protein I6F16_34305 [Bradyrhizobium sp. IC4060]|nr:hypothetical protein [Bradyrhizobium sp. IC4060]MCA1487733.1 hypothetical protein [Bradyrhizobium sp. IC4061]